MDIPTIDYARTDDVGTLRLSGVIDIFEASSLHEAAVRAERDSRAGRVVIDVAAVVRFDTSAWQVLLALRRGLDARKCPIDSRRFPSIDAIGGSDRHRAWHVMPRPPDDKE